VISIRGFGSFGILDHFWSLAIEEQFYMVWPFVVYSFGHRRLIWIALGLFVGAFFIRCGLIGVLHNHPAAYVFTPARMDALAAGAFVALVSRLPSGKETLERYARPLFAAGVLVLVAVLLWRKTSNHDDSVVATVGCSALATLFAAGLVLVRSTPTLERVMSLSGLRFFGKYSSGIDVWHPMVVIIVVHTEEARALRGGHGVVPAISAIMVGIVATGVITAVSWNALEKQLLKLKKHFH
jgi:peptidoglycan/LPS O-acetylase OafA/YrhL